MKNEKGVTIKPAPIPKHRGQPQGSDVTTYDLKAMDPILVDAAGLTKYLREHSEDKEETTE